MLVKLLHEDATLPQRATDGAAGYDITSIEEVEIPPRGRASVSTGVAVAIPHGEFGAVRSRSGLAFKHGVVAFHGTIDSDYRGEVKVLLFNNSDAPYTVKKGDRIAQLVISVCSGRCLMLVDDLSSSRRGSGGFGSTGV